MDIAAAQTASSSAEDLSSADAAADSEGKWRSADEDALASILNYRLLPALPFHICRQT